VTGIEVGVAVIVGVLLGRFLPNRRRGPKPAKAIQPICGCDHHRSFHDPASGECHGRNYEGAGYYSACTCRQYSGPEPLPEYFAPEVTSGETP